MIQGRATLGMLPERAARRWGGREALCFRGRRTTFADLAAGVDRVARGLIALGVRPGRHGRALDAQPSRVDRGAVRGDEDRRRAGAGQHAPAHRRRRLHPRPVRREHADPRRALGPDRLPRHGARAGAGGRAPRRAGCPGSSASSSWATSRGRRRCRGPRCSERVAASASATLARARGDVDPDDARLPHVHVGHDRLPQGRDARPPRSSATSPTAPSAWPSPSRTPS